MIHDPVNSPAHYLRHPSGIECIELTEHLPFCSGNAVKYLWRAGLKDAVEQDLAKALWYVRRERGRLKALFRQPECLDERFSGYAHLRSYMAHNAATRSDMIILSICEGRLASAERVLAAMIERRASK